jgi:hypothetical protein
MLLAAVQMASSVCHSLVLHFFMAALRTFISGVHSEIDYFERH